MTKKNTKKKPPMQVTFPIGSEKVFEEISKIALRLEGDDVDDAKEFIQDMTTEIAKDIFINTILPSDALGNNPQTPRVAETFYKSFDDIFNPTSGAIAKTIKRSGRKATPSVIANHIVRIKSSTINLVQSYLEISDLRMKTKRNVKTSVRGEEVDATDFDYPKTSGKKTSDDYKKLCEVEKNRYIRLCIAAWFMRVVSDLMRASVVDIRKFIEVNKILRISDFGNDYKALFKHLRSNETRKNFVEDARSKVKVGVQEGENVEMPI